MADEKQKLWSVHFTAPHGLPDSGGHNKGDMVGGPYKSKQRARNAVDKKDNEYGAYAHSVRPYGDGHDMSHHGEGKPHGAK